MTRQIDVTLRPEEGALVASLLTPNTLHVYESSIEGLLSIALNDVRDPRYVTAGIRLTREQSRELADALSEYVYGETVDQAYYRGSDNAYDRGYNDGNDLGYELGYQRGRDEVDW